VVSLSNHTNDKETIMKIYACSFAIAGATVVGLIYTALGVILKMYPAQALKFIGTIHMLPKLDYIKSFIKVTPQAITMGIITHTIFAFIVFWCIAMIYNLLQKLFHK